MVCIHRCESAEFRAEGAEQRERRRKEERQTRVGKKRERRRGREDSHWD